MYDTIYPVYKWGKLKDLTMFQILFNNDNQTFNMLDK